jgi:hypothetical protein
MRRNAAVRRLLGMHDADCLEILQLGRQQVCQALAGEPYVVNQQQRFWRWRTSSVSKGALASVAGS